MFKHLTCLLWRSEDHAEHGFGKECSCEKRRGIVPDSDREILERSLDGGTVVGGRLIDVKHCTAGKDVHFVASASLNVSEGKIVCNVQSVQVSPDWAPDLCALIWAPRILVSGMCAPEVILIVISVRGGPTDTVGILGVSSSGRVVGGVVASTEGVRNRRTGTFVVTFFDVGLPEASIISVVGEFAGERVLTDDIGTDWLSSLRIWTEGDFELDDIGLEDVHLEDVLDLELLVTGVSVEPSA